MDSQHGRGSERRRRAPPGRGGLGLLESVVDERPVGRRKLLFGLPRELRKVVQNSSERPDVEGATRLEDGGAAGQMVGHATKPDGAGLGLKVCRPLPKVSQIGARGPHPRLPVRKVAPQLGDELRALVPRREPAPPDTDWVAHEQ
jgi:hypothetical protein